MNGQNLDTRIAIIGAGAAGLSAAYYLKQQGYKRVTVFEKLGRVGGLCRTITDGYRSFDLGANYVTPAYHETLALARSVKAPTIPAHQYVGARVEGERFSYHSTFDLIREDPDEPGDRKKRVGLFALLRALLRYGWLRHKLRPIIDQPTLERIHGHPELCVSFEDWLRDNDLLAMRRLFEIPITTFGYGFMDEIAAPYALKYISPATYRAMLIRGIPGLRRFARWPRRFKYGFQRLWERVSWELNVRLDVKITEIIRNPDLEHPICIRLEREEQVMNEQEIRSDELFFDRLIIACPLTLDVLEGLGLSVSDAERELFEKVVPYSYCHTILHCVDEAGKSFRLKEPVVIIFPFNRETIGKPWAAVQYWGDESPMIQLYTRTSVDRDHEAVQADVERAEKKLLARMKAQVAGDRDPCEGRWKSYTRWPYFGHVSAEDMSKGFYLELEKLQGENATFYVGGVTNFELIEPILQYAKHLVAKHFSEESP